MPSLIGPRQIAVNVKCRVYIGSAYTLPGGTVKWNAVEVDSHSAYSMTTGFWTCPVAGSYLVSAQLKDNATPAGQTVFIMKNGVGVIYSGNSASNAYISQNAIVVMDLAVGDTIGVTTQSVSTVQLDTPAVGNFMHIQLLAGQPMTNVSAIQGAGSVMYRDSNGNSQIGYPGKGGNHFYDVTNRAYVDGKYTGTWQPVTDYYAGDLVDWQGVRYKCNSDFIYANSALPILHVGNVNGGGSTGGAAVGTVALPTGTLAGDTVILSVVSTTTLTFTTRPGGWKQVRKVTQATPNMFQLVLTHVVTSADVTAGNFGLGFTAAAGQITYSCTTFRNVADLDWNNLQYSDTHSGAGTGATYTAPAISLTTGTYYVAVGAAFGGSAVSTAASPSMILSGGTATQTATYIFYKPVTANAIPAQSIFYTWTTSAINSDSGLIIPLIAAPGAPSYPAWSAFENADVVTMRYKALMGSTTANVNIAPTTTQADPGASAVPLLGWDATANGWVCPEQGLYQLNWFMGNHSAVATAMNVYVNGVLQYTATYASSTNSYTLLGELELNYLDVVTIQTSATVGVTAGQHYLSIIRIGNI